MERLTHAQVVNKLLTIKHLRSQVERIQQQISSHEADLLQELVHIEQDIAADAADRGHDTVPIRFMVSEGTLR